ncbi:TPA: tape measure protein [Stenotrophomonas maltophilia]|nr:tape measure protein [Stenotrophomonas maltophilia]HDS1657206.1 tape measure protein [Stenotrophomonas maltophilia]HDS1671224.1 tape measure protein [Stenotrophomonas maltophilia]
MPVTRQSREEVAQLGKASAAMGQQARAGAAGVSSLGNASDQAARKVSAMGAVVNVARSAVAGVVGAQAVASVVKLSDEYANISGRLKLATDGHKAFTQAQSEVFNISQRTSTALESTATLYARLAQSTAEYGISQQRQLALTESINRTFTISGASAVAASNTITQFTQALAGGVLRAEEFNSVIENSPRLAQALADGLGVGMGELRKMVNDGQVSIDKIVGALENQSATIQAEFNQMPLTVERAMVQLRNSVTRYIGEASQELGAGSGLAEGVAFLAQNMEAVGQAANVLAVAFGGKLVANILQATAAKIASAASSRELARQELVAARAAEVQAAGQLSMARAGMSAAGGVAAAEQALAQAQLRTAAAAEGASVALTAKAAAMRGLNVAMSAFGGPVGLAITALSLFVLWLRNSEQEAKELSKTVTAGFQAAIGTLQGFNQETANASFANLAGSIETLDKAGQEVEKLRGRYSDLLSARNAWMARSGNTPPGFEKDLQAAANALDAARVRQEQLTAGYERSIDVAADLVLKSAGITNATNTQRGSLEELLKRQATSGQTLQQNMPLLTKWATEQFNVDTANRLASASFDKVASAAQASGAAIKAALQSVNEGLDKQINSLQLQLIEQTQGKAARMRAEFITSAAAQGLDPTSSDYQKLRAKNEQAIALTLSIERQTKATQAATKADTDAARKAEEAKRKRDQLIETQARYTAEAALTAAELRGPLAAAQERQRQREAELDKELAKGNITQAARNDLVKASTAELAKQTQELNRRQQAPQALLGDMSAELQVLGLLGDARERAQRQMRAEHDMRQAINEANEAGAGINAQMTQSLVNQAAAYAGLSVQVERNAGYLEELARVGGDTAGGISDLLVDAFSEGLDQSKSFFDQLKDIFKRGWRDLARTVMEQNFVRPMQDMFNQMLSKGTSGLFGGGGAGGSWLNNLSSLFGKGGGNWLSTLSGLFGKGVGANAAASAGSMMGFGNVGNLAGIAGANSGLLTGASGATAGTAAGAGTTAGAGAAAGVGAIPIAGWIAAGMMLNSSFYKQGWRMDGQTTDMTETLFKSTAKGNFLGPVLGTMTAGIGAVDRLLKGIGLSGSLASLISGSALWTRAFGRQAPKVTGQGIEGSYGFDGFSGRSYADIKQKGGWFRSDKKWTQYGDVDPGISRLFSSAAAQVKSGVSELAKQLGMDVSGQLANVRVDIGKLQLDADPEKAKAQLEDAVNKMVANLSGEAVKALGLSSLLDKGFEATDIMSAAAGAVGLTNGSVEQLSATLDVFQRMAKESGRTLTEQTEAMAGAAKSYAEVAASAQEDVATAGLSSFAKSMLSIRREEQQRIATLKEQAKALGGLSARESDLMAVRQAAEQKANDLAKSLQSELVDLALGRVNDQIERLGGSAEGASDKLGDFLNSLRMSDTLSVNTDAQKRSTASDLMSSAAASGNVDSFITYAQRFLEVSRAMNASGSRYQADYAEVMRMAQQFGADGSANSLEQLYAQREALQAQQEAAARLDRAQRIAQGVADLAGVKGGDPLEILRNTTGMTPEDLAKDLGLSIAELSEYLTAQNTDLGDLAEILNDLPTRIAQAMVAALRGETLPTASFSGRNSSAPGELTSPGYGPSEPLLVEIRDGIRALGRSTEQRALNDL